MSQNIVREMVGVFLTFLNFHNQKKKQSNFSKKQTFEQRLTMKCLNQREENIKFLQQNPPKSEAFWCLIVCSDTKLLQVI